jgi:hypothetical protein
MAFGLCRHEPTKSCREHGGRPSCLSPVARRATVLLRLRDRPGRVHQPDVAERLREVAEYLSRRRVHLSALSPGACCPATPPSVAVIGEDDPRHRAVVCPRDRSSPCLPGMWSAAMRPWYLAMWASRARPLNVAHRVEPAPNYPVLVVPAPPCRQTIELPCRYRCGPSADLPQDDPGLPGAERARHAQFVHPLQVPCEAPCLCGRRGPPQSRGAEEAAVIQRVLGECGGNPTEAAKCLGIGRSTLYRKLRASG